MPSSAYLDAFRQLQATQGQPYAVPTPVLPTVSPFLADLRAGIAPPPSAMGATALADASGAGSGPPTVENARPAPAPVVADVPAGSMSAPPPVEAGGSSQLPPPPAVVKSDPADGGVTAPPALVSVEPPPPPPAEPAASVQGTGGGSGAQPFLSDPSDLNPTGGGKPAAAPIDPAVTEADKRLDAIGAEARRTSAGTRTPAHWQGNERSVEGKMIDPAAKDEYDAAQAQNQALTGEVLGFRAQLADKMRQKEGEKEGIKAQGAVAQAKAGQAFGTEQAKIAADLTEQRRKLSNPNDYWEGKNSAYRVGMALSGVLEGVLQGAAGVKIEPGKVLDGAIKDHVDVQMRKLGFITQKRDESKEKFAQESAARAGATQAALLAVDDQLKDMELQGKNPIIKTIVWEQKPAGTAPEGETDPSGPQNALDRVAFELAKKARALGHDLAPEVIAGKAPPPPDDPMGPNPVKAPPPAVVIEFQEQARFLGAELEASEKRLAAAREKLQLEERLAATQKSSEKFKEATVSGGKKRDLATELAVEKARRENREGNRELNVKEKDADTRASAEGGKGAEKAGARTFVMEGPLGPQEFEARPGTPETEMTKIRDQGASLSAVQREVKALEQVLTLGDKVRMNAELPARIRALGGAVNSAQGQGAMNDNDTKWFNDTMGGLLTNGIGAAKAMTGYLGNLQSAKAQQVGAVATGGKK